MSDMYMWIDVAAVLLLSVVCAGVLIPRILLISFRKRLFDRPDERKIHQCIVPRLGGIAFVPVIMVSVMLVTGVSLLLGDDRLARQMGTEATELSFACCSLIVLYLVGIADDLIGVRYRANRLADDGISRGLCDKRHKPDRRYRRPRVGAERGRADVLRSGTVLTGRVCVCAAVVCHARHNSSVLLL